MTTRSTEEPSRLVIVIDLPQELRAVNRVIRALAVAWPRSTIDTNPKQKTVRITGWLIHIKQPTREEDLT